MIGERSVHFVDDCRMMGILKNLMDEAVREVGFHPPVKQVNNRVKS